MFLLRVLGTAGIEGPSGPLAGRIAQRRRMALLAVLARKSSISRDKLIALLWPETDAVRGRHLLSDSLYLIRKALGSDAVQVAGDQLMLNSEVLDADVLQFEQALRQGDLERAIVLYRGPFLDGLFIRGAVEFERWAEIERQRLDREYRGALTALADVALERGDDRRAVELCEMLVADDPYDAAATLRLVRAIGAAGDRSGALQRYRSYALRVREDLGVEPDAALVEFAQGLASSPGAPSGLQGGNPNTSPGGNHPREPAAEREQIENRVATTSPPARGPRAIAGVPPLPFAALLLAVILGIFLLWRWLDQRDRPAPLDDGDRIAVLRFTVRGSDRFAAIGNGVPALLAKEFRDQGAFESVDPWTLSSADSSAGPISTPPHGQYVARRSGARYFVIGEVEEAAGTIQIHTALYDGDRDLEPVAEITVEGGVEDLFTLVDQLAEALAANTSAFRESQARGSN